jgi:hypothetical protein
MGPGSGNPFGGVQDRTEEKSLPASKPTPMPTLLRLVLVPGASISLATDRAPAQGWFLSLVARIDPDAAAALHKPAAPRTYTVSPLHRPTGIPIRDEHQESRTPLELPDRTHPGEPLAIRCALADDNLAQHLLDRLPSVELPRLNGHPVQLARCPASTTDDPDVLPVAWPALAAAPPARRLRIVFATPTVFASQGEDILFPDPARLFDSWRRAWDNWSAGAVPLPEAIVPRPRVSRYRLNTEAIALKGGLQRGFVGELECAFPPDTDETTRRVAVALAGLANLSGTGARTALGMGQTRAMSLPEN